MPPTCDIFCSTTSPTAGPALGHSWAAIGPLLVALGPPLAALVPPLAALGPPMAALGPLLERHVKIHEISMPKMIDLGTPKAPKMSPKSNKKWSKIDAKKRSDKKSRTKTILGRLGRRLWVKIALPP